jgi:hypothetical protein
MANSACALSISSGGLLSRQRVDCFRVLAPQRHAPRISLDSLIIKRESWRFSPEEMQFACCASAAERFLQARNWARIHGIPRFVSYRVPVERKPAYLDFDSPIFVDIFSKMIRRTVDATLPGAMVDLSEMPPLFDQIWLADASGRRYTSELSAGIELAEAGRVHRGLPGEAACGRGCVAQCHQRTGQRYARAVRARAHPATRLTFLK